MKIRQNEEEDKKSKDNCLVKLQHAGKTGKGRLSKQILYNLRNRIPIQNLIENELGLQNHMDSGIFRFECPLCSSFHTSVMKNKNLARCFDCKINFNTIDMVMEVRKTGFRQSADFLLNFLNTKQEEKPDVRGAGTPLRIGKVLSKSNFSKSLPDKKINHDSIKSLEKDIDDLKYRIDQLQKFIVNVFSKKRQSNNGRINE